jgi:hypothetical protein
MNHVKLFEQFVNEALNPMEFETAVKNLAYSMPNHTKYDTDGVPSDEQIMKAMQKYEKDLYKHSTSAQKKEAVEMVKQILSESLDEALINEEKTASEKLADEVSGELYKATLRGNSATVTATTTTQTWDDGVPVLKYLARGKSKPVKIEKKVFNVVHDVAHGWFYFSDGRKWFGLHVSDGYADPSDLPFDVKIAESMSVEMSKFKVGQKIKWSSPKGPKEDEIEKVDGIYLKLKSGGTIPYQSVIAEGVVNEAKTSLDDMMKWIENSMKFVRTSEEFDGNDGGIWVSGENGDRYKGKRIYDYYSEDPKNYELGVLKDWEKELNKRGWYSEWYDAGTVMIWPY